MTFKVLIYVHTTWQAGCFTHKCKDSIVISFVFTLSTITLAILFMKSWGLGNYLTFTTTYMKMFYLVSNLDIKTVNKTYSMKGLTMPPWCYTGETVLLFIFVVFAFSINKRWSLTLTLHALFWCYLFDALLLLCF